MIRALVVDDEPLSRRAVRQMCARHPDVVVVGECRNAVEAAAALRAAAVDVVFLDVKMPGRSGLDLARGLGGPALPLVVMVTAYDEFALPAFDSAAIDYVTKPIDPERFARSLERVRKQLALVTAVPGTPQESRFLRHLVARQRDRDVLVPVEAITYIAADDVYAVVHSPSGDHLVRQSLDVLEQQLDPSLFVRVHRSFIVQLKHVIAIRRGQGGERTVIVQGGAEVPVSRRRRGVIQDMLTRRGTGPASG